MTHPTDEHDARLLANVRPPGWANPEPAPSYNLVVLGGGPAGLVCAAGAAGLGARVALVERGRLGGDCLNVGCVPSKALLASARVCARVRDAGAFGVRVPGGVSVDFAAVMGRMRALRADLSAADSADRFRGLGVDVFLGAGRFAGPDRVEVGGRVLRFRRAVIATGSRPRVPNIPGLADAGFLTNETVFSLAELPPDLAVVGAGPVGCELAQAFARFGSRVTLIGRRPQILPAEDADAAGRVADALCRDGVELRLGREVARVEVREGRKLLHLTGGESVPVVADALLVAAGRVPNVDGLDLDLAGVGFDAKTGVGVDDRLRTANARVFAAGDVCSRHRTTHAADALARVAVRNALFPWPIRARAGALVLPHCTYTDPELARVGLSEAEARQGNVAYRALTVELRDVDRAVLDGEGEGFARLLSTPRGDRILGATVVAAHAGDLIAEVVLAMTAGLGPGALARSVRPYPTQSEVFKRLGDAHNRGRLTPTARGLLARWMRWTR